MDALERKHFEEHGTLPVLDYLATLIHITGSLWQMETTYNRVGYGGASKDGRQILQACQDAAVALTLAATRRDPAAHLQKVRLAHLPALREAAQNSLLLARNEQAETGAAGLFTKHVHARLLALVTEWEGQPVESRPATD